MTDEEFLNALEMCELPESAFGHAARNTLTRPVVPHA